MSQFSSIRFLLTTAIRLVLHYLVKFNKVQIELFLGSLVIVLTTSVTPVIQLDQLHVL